MAKRKRRKLRKGALVLLIVLALAICSGIAFFIKNQFKNESTIENTPLPTEQSGMASIDPSEEPSEEHYSTSLFMLGDALLHLSCVNSVEQADGSYDFDSEFYRIMKYSDGYDLKFYNQETILGGKELGLSNYPMFNSPQEFGTYMISQGFNLISTATNHSFDKGITGITNSYNFWNAQEGVVSAGTYTSKEAQEEIPVYEKNGITYTFLSWTYGLNGFVLPEGQEYLVNTFEYDTEPMLEQVRNASELADVCIISIHWGDEYSNEPNEVQRTLGQELADAGADIIIGNHVHTIQPIEWLNDGETLCFYALGNFISAQNQPNSNFGMMAGLTINKTVYNEETTISIDDVKVDLFYDYYVSDGRNYNFEEIPFTEITEDNLGTDFYNTVNNNVARYSYERYGFTTAQEMYEYFIDNVIHKYDSSIQVGGF